jgi:hypothetical protein
MSPLFRELLTAHRTARLPELAPALQACGLPIDGASTWGVGFVDIDSHNYATGLGTRSTRTRHGIATVLGREWLDRAKDTETAVRLFADPIGWLHNGCRGAVVIDWRAARYELGDVPAIVSKTNCWRREWSAHCGARRASPNSLSVRLTVQPL